MWDHPNRRRTGCFRALVAFGLAFSLSLTTSGHAADTFTSAYISEFLAVNQTGLKDDDGDLSAWIEIYNASSATLDLRGWFLTDDPAHLTKWRFPAVSVLPDKYMVVFASAKDRNQDLAHLHTNFRLNEQSSCLALVGPATNVISQFAPVRLAADVSYGRVRGEPTLFGPMPRPTPGRPNPSSGPGFAPEISFSRSSGTFTTPFTVQLLSRATGAVIRYTLDGNQPNGSSPVYGAPLLVTNTAQIRARACQDGLFPGPPHGEAYLRLHTNVVDFTSTLPVLIMETFGKDVPASSHSSFVHLSFYEPVNGKTSLTNQPTLTTRGGYHVRGSTSSGMPQSGFAVQLLDEFNQEQHLPVLGLPAESDWILYAPNSYDPVMIHNPFIHQLSREMGRYSPRTRFVEVYWAKSSGPIRSQHYHGVYVLEEKIKIGGHRVDIDRIGPDDLKPPRVTGGYLLKFDRLGPGESGFSTGGPTMVYVDPKEPLLSLPQRAPQRRYLSAYFSEFDQALDGANWKDPVRGYRAYFDVDAAIDFHLLEVLSGNVDSIVLSTYFYKPRNGRIVCGPHWDFDRALGSTDGRDENPRRWNTGPFFGGAWWPRLFSDPDFWQQWVDRWQEERRTHFSLSHLNGLIDRLAGELREAQPREYQRWGFQPRGGSYQSEIDLMKQWLSNRVDFIDQQLVQPPRLQVAGGRLAPGSTLTLTASTNATVYFTVDGSDPRLSQGGISSNALIYSRPVPLPKEARVVARARDPHQHQTDGPPLSTPWSGPVTENFVVARP